MMGNLSPVSCHGNQTVTLRMVHVYRYPDCKPAACGGEMKIFASFFPSFLVLLCYKLGVEGWRDEEVEE